MSLQIETLFNVEGKIVVITGGGTGTIHIINIQEVSL